jgi:protein SCO1/2
MQLFRRRDRITGNSPRTWKARFIVAAAALCAICSAIAPVATAQQPQWGAGYIPNVPVIDQDGRKLMFYDDVIKGRIVVVSFIYTVCKDMCPLITARLALLQDKLGDAAGRDFFFVSVSIDPERDTPERLKQFAEAFRVGPGWLFLTGSRADIDQIRNKLGERTKTLTEHRNEILLGNDRTGEWARDSAFADLVVLDNNLRAMDPAWLYRDGESPSPPAAQAVVARDDNMPGQTLFVKTCGSCHTIGKGDRVGPDLAGLLARRPRSWVESYISAPDRVRAGGDPIARELSQKFRAVRMPNLSMSPHDVADLLQYIDTRSAQIAQQTR